MPSPSAAFGRLVDYRPVLDRLVFVLALLGVLTTVHLWIQQGRGFDRGCFGFTSPEAVEATFNCEAVVRSSAGQLFGISNVVWGLLFYVGVAALSAGVSFSAQGRRPLYKRLRAVVIAGGFLYSAYLIFYQYAVLGEFCALCLTSALIVTALLLTQVVDVFTKPDRKLFTMQPKITREVGLFATLSVLTLLLAGADVLYFNSLEATRGGAATPAQPVAGMEAAAPGTADCHYDTEKGYYEDYADLVNFSDPMKGNAEADVVVVEVFEPNCGHCKALYPVMERVVEEHSDEAQFYYKPVVFWADRSLAQTMALHAAAQEGKFFEMLDQQFARQNPQTGLGLPQLRQIADQIGMEADAMVNRIQGGMYRSMVQRQNELLMEDLGIRSVPAVLINGRFVAADSRTEECLGELIEAAADAS